MSSFDFNYLLRSPSGKIKLTAVVVGFLAVVFCGAGHDRHASTYIGRIGTIQAGSVLCSYEQSHESKLGVKDDRGYFERCPRFGFAQAGLAFVIIAWLFSLEIMVVSAMPSVIEQPPMRTIDALGHLGAGIMGILGFLLVIIYTYNLYALKFGKYECGREGISDEEKSFCIKTFFWQGVPDGASDDTEASGQMMLLWIFGALIALVHGILCFVIYPQAARAKKTGGLPMIMVNPSSLPQVAPVSYPNQNQEEYQQETGPMPSAPPPPPPPPPPEEEEEAPPAHVHRHHHSKHSHKDKKHKG